VLSNLRCIAYTDAGITYYYKKGPSDDWKHRLKHTKYDFAARTERTNANTTNQPSATGEGKRIL